MLNTDNRFINILPIAYMMELLELCAIGTTVWSFGPCFEECCPDSCFLTALIGLWRRRWIGSLLSFPFSMWDGAQLAFHKSLFPLFCRDLPRGARALFLCARGLSCLRPSAPLAGWQYSSVQTCAIVRGPEGVMETPLIWHGKMFADGNSMGFV